MKEASAAINATKKKSERAVRFINHIPTGFRIGINPQAPFGGINWVRCLVHCVNFQTT